MQMTGDVGIKTTLNQQVLQPIQPHRLFCFYTIIQPTGVFLSWHPTGGSGLVNKI